MSKLSGNMAKRAVKLMDWLMYRWNISLERWGVPGDRFGSVVISPLESFNVEQAWIPLFPFSRTPIAVGVGDISEKAVVKNGKVVAEKRLSVTITFDHRVFDGVHLGKARRRLATICQSPETYFGGVTQEIQLSLLG